MVDIKMFARSNIPWRTSNTTKAALKSDLPLSRPIRHSSSQYSQIPSNASRDGGIASGGPSQWGASHGGAVLVISDTSDVNSDIKSDTT
ncbi:uncharacterized protein PG998_002904 [Apiospora kogelbergensis]|uniref:uncharacterized protein n=1 Tax=Apiospora kogelbergensis TaxID=1337665 RepID=UPI00312CF2E0